MKDIFSKLKSKIIFLKQNFGRIILLLIPILIFLFLVYFYKTYFVFGNLKISFFEVGQGDSIFIETPSHKKILIDSGPGEQVVGEIDKNMRFFDRNIDLAILSHNDQDHIAGLLPLFKKYNFKKIIWNGDDNKKTLIWQEIKKIINSNYDSEIASGKRLVMEKTDCGEKIDFNDGVIIYTLHPRQNNLSQVNANKNSVVSLLTYKNYSVLFTGDATQGVEKEIFLELENCFDEKTKQLILSKLKNLTILKSSHHGSNTSNGEYLLKNSKPVYTVISVGKNNKYKLPNEQALARIKKYSKYILRTDEDGNITFEIGINSFGVEKDK